VINLVQAPIRLLQIIKIKKNYPGTVKNYGLIVTVARLTISV